MSNKVAEKLKKYDKEIKRINDNIVYRIEEYKKMLDSMTKNSNKSKKFSKSSELRAHSCQEGKNKVR